MTDRDRSAQLSLPYVWNSSPVTSFSGRYSSCALRIPQLRLAGEIYGQGNDLAAHTAAMI